MVYGATGESLLMVPAALPHTAEEASQQHGRATRWLADNPVPIHGNRNGAGFLRLTPSSNNGKALVHRTEIRKVSSKLWNGNRIARGERCSPRGSVAPHHCFG